jgi:hypothetical protein
MDTPLKRETSRGTAAIADEIGFHARQAEAVCGRFTGRARANPPAGRCGNGCAQLLTRAEAQEECRRGAVTRGEREPARRAQIEFRGPAQFSEDGGERRGAQRMFHHVQHFICVRREHEQDARDVETERFETGAIGCAVLDGREVMTNPESRLVFFAGERAHEDADAKAAGRSRIAFGLGRRFMERAAHQAAAESPVDFGFTEGQRARIDGRPGKPRDREP